MNEEIKEHKKYINNFKKENKSYKLIIQMLNQIKFVRKN